MSWNYSSSAIGGIKILIVFLTMFNKLTIMLIQVFNKLSALHGIKQNATLLQQSFLQWDHIARANL